MYLSKERALQILLQIFGCPFRKKKNATIIKFKSDKVLNYEDHFLTSAREDWISVLVKKQC